ncbi:MAG: GNAT family N-acetyltransferase [Terriglobales bacterium]
METCSPDRVLATTIRLAIDADIPRLVEMGQRFRAESRYAKFLADNPERMAHLGRQLLACDGLLAMERDGEIIGMLGFILHDHFISGEKVAGEVFWWVEPEHRGDGLKLLDETKRRAKAAGAKCLHMIAPSERVSRLYKILGYEWVEATYQISL